MEHKVVEPNRKYHVRDALFWWLGIAVIGILVVGAGVLFILAKIHRHYDPEQHSAVPTNVIQKYATALDLALQFFDVQKSGKLHNNRISWRGDLGLRDGSEAGLDLSKGMYDAGDLTVLSWAILEYGDQMNAVTQLQYAQDALKSITDYLINAHPSADVL